MRITLSCVSSCIFTAQLNYSQPVNYNILLNPESDPGIMHHAGRDLHLTVTGLEPFTTYQLRVQACQMGNYLSFIIFNTNKNS